MHFRIVVGFQLSTLNGGYVIVLQGILSKPEHAPRGHMGNVEGTTGFQPMLCKSVPSGFML